MKKIKLFFALGLVAMLVGAVSCSFENQGNKEVVYTTMTFIDGSDIEVPTEIETYATLSPSYTETLIDLGFEKNIVTIDSGSTYLDIRGSNANVLDVDKIDLNHKALLENNPDVILVENYVYIKFTEEEVKEIIENGSTFIVLPSVNSIEAVRNELDFIVRLTGAKYGDDILEDFDLKYAQLLNWKNQVNEFPVVFLQTRDSRSVKTTGSGTLLNEMIFLSGGTNAFVDKNGVLFTTYEEVAARQPDYYFAITNGESTQKNQIINNAALSETTAIRNDEVYIFTEVQMFNPNYRCLDAINTMGCILHRDIYK